MERLSFELVGGVPAVHPVKYEFFSWTYGLALTRLNTKTVIGNCSAVDELYYLCEAEGSATHCTEAAELLEG